MINSDNKKAIKQLCQSGALSIIELLINEIKQNMEQPKYETTAEKLLYDTGYYQGQSQAYDIFLEYLINIAKDV